MGLFGTKKTALVLAGGGARGAYHIGVWKALRELRVKIDIVTGTSVGALTGGMVAQGDFDTALEVFSNIKYSDVMDLPDNLNEVGGFLKYVAKNGGVDTSPLQGLLDRCVDEQAVRKSGIGFGMVTVRKSDLFPVEATLDTIPNGELLKYMLASASIFPFFASPDIEGEKYVDGGIFNNLPIGLAEDMGANDIIAVDLEAIGIEKPYLGGLPVRYIRPSWPLGSIIEFESESARRNIQLGYLDAMKAFRVYDGVKYAVARGDYQKGASNPAVGIARQRIELAPAITARAVLSDLSQEYDAHRSNRRMLLALAECAAQAMELDCLKSYSLAELNREILNAYNESGPLSVKISGIAVTADINRRSAAVSMVRALADDKATAELAVLSSAFRREFAGAAYISSLFAGQAAKH